MQIPKPGAPPAVPSPGKPKVPPPSGLGRPAPEPEGASKKALSDAAKAPGGNGRGGEKSASADDAPGARSSSDAEPSESDAGSKKPSIRKTSIEKTSTQQPSAETPSANASKRSSASGRGEAPNAATAKTPSKPRGDGPVAGKMPFAEKPITGSRSKVDGSKLAADGSGAKPKPKPPPTPANAGQSAKPSRKAGAAGTSAAKPGKYAKAVTAAKTATAEKRARESAAKAAETGERAGKVDAPDGESRAFDREGLTLPPPVVSAAQEESSPSRRMRRDPSLVLELDAVDRPVLRDEPDPIATFARFELLGRLATGGMAEIFLARESLETSASRHTAIKIIRGEFAEDGDFANMFLNEGRLAMRLTHPNICTVYECGRHAGRFFMAMEYVHGQTLREVLVRAAKTKRTMPIPALLKIFAIVAEALDFAHRARDSQGRLLRIVHRDVSPHNVMVRYDGVVKLLDFGVAKAEHSSHATEAGALKGKFSYMSPEQAMAEPIDHRADIFSLGVCIFEAITGRRLFHRKAQYDTLKAILEQDPPALSSFRDDVPDGLEDILKRALSKKPDERYQRAAELQHDLEHLLTEMREVVSTSQIAALMEELFVAEMERGPQLDTADDIRERFAPGSELDAAETLPPPTQRLPVWLAAAAGLILLVGGGAWALMSRDDADPTPAADVSRPPAETSLAPPPSPADPVETDSPAVGTGEATSSADVSPAGETPEDETPNSPTEEGEDATLAASPDGTAPDEGDREAGGADDRPEEAASRSTTERRGRGSSTDGRGGGRAGRQDRGSGRGSGTVIVTDPGF